MTQEPVANLPIEPSWLHRGLRPLRGCPPAIVPDQPDRSDRHAALEAACWHAVTGAAILVVADQMPGEDAAQLADRLGRSVATRWTSPSSAGRADRTGVTVTTPGSVHVSWREVADVICRGLTPSRKAHLEHLSARLNRYDADQANPGAHQARSALVRAEVEQLRVSILTSGLAATRPLRSTNVTNGVRAKGIQR